MKPDDPTLRVSIEFVLQMEDGPRGGYSAGMDVEGNEGLVGLIRANQDLFKPATNLLVYLVTSVLTNENLVPPTPFVAASKVGRA